MKMEDTGTLIVERQRIADKSEQQCPCQDYSGSKYCTCDEA